MNNFTEQKWKEVGEKISYSFRLSSEETERFHESRVAKLIASIPFIADCDEPDRYALSHLSTYMMSISPACKPVANHSTIDDKSSGQRLLWLNHFDSGNKRIINKGMKLLALIQLNGYYRDRQKDVRLGKYNPLNAGVWNYESMKEELINEIQSIECAELDRIVDVNSAELAWGF